MFSALSKVVDFFWTEEEIKVQNDESNQISEQSLSSNAINTDSNKQESINVQYVTGKVTHLFNAHGLINSDIYFTFDKVLGERVPGLGEEVTVTAKRKNEFSGWHAEQVAIATIQEWEEEEEETVEAQSMVGIVSSYRNGNGTINDNTFFSVKDIEGKFDPKVGDYVTADLENKDGVTWACCVKPLRRVEKEGVVSCILTGNENGQILILKNFCIFVKLFFFIKFI